jgi:hypothetical protein
MLRDAIPSFPGFQTEGPQPTGIVLTPCTTLPEYQLSPCQAGIGMRAVHSVGRAATTHEFLLLLPILLILWSSSVGKLAVSGFKVSATGLNPLRDVVLGRKKGTRYGPTMYLILIYAIKQLRTYNLPFIYNHNIMKINSELKLTNQLSLYTRFTNIVNIPLKLLISHRWLSTLNNIHP